MDATSGIFMIVIISKNVQMLDGWRRLMSVVPVMIEHSVMVK